MTKRGVIELGNVLHLVRCSVERGGQPVPKVGVRVSRRIVLGWDMKLLKDP